MRIVNSLTFTSYYGLSKIESNLKLKINLISTYMYLLYLKTILKLTKTTFFVSSKNLTVVTVFRSPMAQKTWSREQVFIKYFKWSVKLEGCFGYSKPYPFFILGRFFGKSLSNSLLLLYRTKVQVSSKYKLIF